MIETQTVQKNVCNIQTKIFTIIKNCNMSLIIKMSMYLFFILIRSCTVTFSFNPHFVVPEKQLERAVVADSVEAGAHVQLGLVNPVRFKISLQVGKLVFPIFAERP